MTEYPILTKAPISEALIDIRVKLPSSIGAKEIGSIYESIKVQYPQKKELIISEVSVDIKSKEPVKSVGDNLNGYRCVTSDNKQVLQTRLDGFTFNRLHPYVSWEEFRNEAYRLWQIYKDVTSPESITHVALRYINKVDIPLPIEDFADYLTAPPTVPEELPQGVSSFLTRVVIPEPSIDAKAVITQALEQIEKDSAPIILDIDVYRHQPEGIKEEEAWETIDKLRNFKNKIFFNIITDKLKEIYK